MKDVDGSGRLYEIDYTVDYKLDAVLKSGCTETNQLFNYVAYLLYDSLPQSKAQVSFDAGCSAFAVPDPQSGNFLMGRNYDFCHATEDRKGYKSIAAIMVHTAPQGGKKSISMVDGMQLGYGQGFYTDGNTDLSLLMGLPYAALDGICHRRPCAERESDTAEHRSTTHRHNDSHTYVARPCVHRQGSLGHA